LARPGGNITGVTSISAALSKKRSELLEEVASSLSPVAVLWEPRATSGTTFQMRDTENAARDVTRLAQSLAQVFSRRRTPRRTRQKSDPRNIRSRLRIRGIDRTRQQC